MISECKIRRGPTFGPVKYVSHVMHAKSLLVHPNFSSKLMITGVFDQFESGPKVGLSHESRDH